MLDITELRVVQPHEMEPGTLLLTGAHYSDPPIFIFTIGEEKFWFEVGGKRGFQGRAMAINLHPCIVGAPPKLIVDIGTTISPTRSDIPPGSAVLIGDEPCFAIQINYGTAYVRIDGQLIDQPRSYDRLVAFPRWQLVVPGFGIDKWKVIHDARAE
jgi:hypothetical protein